MFGKVMYEIGKIRVYAYSRDEAEKLAAQYHRGELDHDTLIKTIELPETDDGAERPALDWDDPMVTFQSLCAQALHCIETPNDFTADEQERLELDLADAMNRQL